jgi:hypothetical protein
MKKTTPNMSEGNSIIFNQDMRQREDREIMLNAVPARKEIRYDVAG